MVVDRVAKAEKSCETKASNALPEVPADVGPGSGERGPDELAQVLPRSVSGRIVPTPADPSANCMCGHLDDEAEAKESTSERKECPQTRWFGWPVPVRESGPNKS